MLPMKPGQVERHTHDYKRNGTTSLVAALNVATGEVNQQARPHHTAPIRELHVILDNVSHPQDARCGAWLKRHPRITFHFTPTSTSWMNEVETWFSVLTRQAIRPGTF